MKTTVGILAVVVILLFAAKTTIQLRPFRITFENWVSVLGIVLIWVGFAIVHINGVSKARTQGYSDGLSKGAEISREAAIEAAREIIAEEKKRLKK